MNLSIIQHIKTGQVVANARTGVTAPPFLQFHRQDRVNIVYQMVDYYPEGGLKRPVQIVDVSDLDIRMAIGRPGENPLAMQINWTRDEESNSFTGQLNLHTNELEAAFDAAGNKTLSLTFEVEVVEDSSRITLQYPCRIVPDVIRQDVLAPEEILPPAELSDALAQLFEDSNSVGVERNGNAFKWHVRRQPNGGVYESPDGIYIASRAPDNLLDGALRLESPQGSGTNAQNLNDSTSVVAGGTPGKIYEAQIRIRGVVELKYHVGGEIDVAANFAHGGEPQAGPENSWWLEVSNPPGLYYLNAALSGPRTPKVLDSTRAILVAGGATLTLLYDTVDGLQYSNPGLVVPDIPPAPAAYNGQFIQIDLVSDEGEPIGTGMTNPMTAAGDMIRGGSEGTPVRLPIGTSGQILRVISGLPVWDNETPITSHSTHAINSTGSTAVLGNGQRRIHSALLQVSDDYGGGPFTHVVFFPILNLERERVFVRCELPASADPTIEFHNAAANGALLLAVQSVRIASVLWLDLVYNGTGWMLEKWDWRTITGERILNTYTRETVPFAAVFVADLDRAAYQEVTLTGNVTISTLAVSRAAVGSVKAVTLLLTASGGNRTIAFAAGIKVLGSAPGTLNDGKTAAVCIVSRGANESDTRVAAAKES